MKSLGRRQGVVQIIREAFSSSLLAGEKLGSDPYRILFVDLAVCLGGKEHFSLVASVFGDICIELH